MTAAAFLLRTSARRLVRSWPTAVVVGVLFAVAAATVTVALGLRAAPDDAWQRLHAQTDGADVQVASMAPIDTAALAARPGVAAVGEVVTRRLAAVTVGSKRLAAALLRMPGPTAPLDRPLLVAGRRPAAADEVAYEASFARAHDVQLGDTVHLPAGVARVVGIAATTMTPGYPATAPGTVFTADVRTEPEPGMAMYSVGVRLQPGADPAAVALPGAVVTTAADIRAEALADVRIFEVILLAFGVLLGTGAAFLLVTLLTAAVVAERRRLALLRIAGLTPRQAAALLAAEQTAVAAAGAAVGSLAAAYLSPWAGRLAAPAVVGVTSTGPALGTAVAVWLGIAALTAVVASVGGRRAARTPLAEAVRGTSSRTSASSSLVARALRGTVGRSRGLPAVHAVAVASATSHRLRAFVTAASVVLAVTAGMAALGMEATFARAEARQHAAGVNPPPGLPGLPPDGGGNAAEERSMRVLVYALEIALAALAAGNLVVATVLSTRERTRDTALLRAAGLSVRQATTAAAGSQVVLAAVAAVVGIPMGIGFFRLAYELANGDAGDIAYPSLPATVAVLPVVCLVVAALAVVSVRRSGRPTIAAALAHE